jgi:hypothetical protein
MNTWPNSRALGCSSHPAVAGERRNAWGDGLAIFNTFTAPASTLPTAAACAVPEIMVEGTAIVVRPAQPSMPTRFRSVRTVTAASS